MPLVPADFPQRLAAMGVPVQVMSDWAGAGGSANHTAVVMHHTASSASASPSNDAAYCAHGSSDAPLYNVLVDRTGVAWVLARNKSNSSGKISGTALGEVQRGQANLASAASRGLSDTTSDNAGLFAVSAQNNGTGEPWSSALTNAMAITCACALQCLALPHAGFVTDHKSLTSRKVDLTMGQHGCPSASEWPQLIQSAMSGGSREPEVPEVWLVQGVIPAPHDGEVGHLLLPLPAARAPGTATFTCYLDDDEGGDNGASLWGSATLQGDAFGAWNKGVQWELWLPPRYGVTDYVRDDAYQLRFENRGPSARPVSVSISGT